MKLWKHHIQTGNEHFRNEAFTLAQHSYLQACIRAEKLLEQHQDKREVVAAITISYHNLADSLKCQGRYQDALDELENIHRFVCQRLSEAEKGSDFYNALLEARENTVCELQHFAKTVRVNTDLNTTIYPLSPPQISGIS